MPGFFSQPKTTLKNDLLSLLVPVSMMYGTCSSTVASRINASLYEKLISNFEISRMNIFLSGSNEIWAVDPHQFFADPDPAGFLNAESYPAF